MVFIKKYWKYDIESSLFYATPAGIIELLKDIMLKLLKKLCCHWKNHIVGLPISILMARIHPGNSLLQLFCRSKNINEIVRMLTY